MNDVEIKKEVGELQLRITEIFHSLQGESTFVGLPTVFVRLTGCPLRCVYCDTEYAFKGGYKKSIFDIIKQVRAYDTPYITVTGGEPLAQQNCVPLLNALCDLGFTVSLETSGALDVSTIDSRVIKILDLKTPASGECQKNLYSNLDFLNPQDQVKFIICNKADYDWTLELFTQYDLLGRTQILFSPEHKQLAAKDLAGWILADKLPVRMQLQMHKYIWGDVAGV